MLRKIHPAGRNVSVNNNINYMTSLYTIKGVLNNKEERFMLICQKFFIPFSHIGTRKIPTES